MNKAKLRFYPVMILTLITCLAIASFTVATHKGNKKDISVTGEHYWSVYYLDTCQQESPYMWVHYQAFAFVEERSGYKILIDTNGEKAGYWDSSIDIHGNHIIRIDLFDAVGVSFINVDGTAILEGHGKLISVCGAPHVFTKFLLVKK